MQDCELFGLAILSGKCPSIFQPMRLFMGARNGPTLLKAPSTTLTFIGVKFKVDSRVQLERRKYIATVRI